MIDAIGRPQSVLVLGGSSEIARAIVGKLVPGRCRTVVLAGRTGTRLIEAAEEARAAGIPTDGDSVTVGDVLVTLCPWWDGPVGRARVEAQLAADSERRLAHWVWVYHWPPIGSPTCWTGRKDYGDSDLAGWIGEHRPDLVLTGHVHESPFKPDGNWVDRVGRTWVFNAGSQIGPVPAHIVLDLGAQKATWSSMLGTEEVGLHEAAAPARSVF